MIPDNIDKEELKKITLEELEKLKLQGNNIDESLIELVKRDTSQYHRIIHEQYFKEN